MTTRRKKKTCLTLSVENAAFIREVILPSQPDCKGRFTRGLALCIEHSLAELADTVPEIPHREGRPIKTVDCTLEPETMNDLDEIVSYWHGTPRQCNRSQVVDFFIDDLRRQVAEIQANQ